MPTKYHIDFKRKYGRLTVLAIAYKKRGATYYKCKCKCGRTIVVRKDALYTGKQVSCGCYGVEVRRASVVTHGMSGDRRPPEYDAWAHMLRRCYTPTTEGYEQYGGRGITVCDRWRYSFENFFQDMGRRPTAHHSLDRKNNNGNYGPDNCRWATDEEQSNNTRQNTALTFNDQTMNMGQWSRFLKMKPGTLSSRIQRGWTIERALTTPVRASVRV